MSLKALLSKSLPRKFHSQIPSSFDLIGNREKAVAIVEIPPQLRKYRRKISAAIMSQHKNVRTVLEKGTPRKGVFRTRDYKLLAGSPDTEVMHHESGCRFLVDPRTAYFSTREGTERLRVASLVKNSETVMVFFAGVGPFAVVIAKKADAGKVIGIELNPAAVEYFRKNVALNKCRNIEVVAGDVRKTAPAFYGMCDRVIMPLPETAREFLPEAFRVLRPGGMIHLYTFAGDDEIADLKKSIRHSARQQKRTLRFAGINKVLPYGPRIWKMRIDMVVS